EAHGLQRSQVRFGDRVLRLAIREYTREAGVRNLERQIAALCRKAATQVAKGKAKRIRLDAARVREWLGPRRFPADVRKRTSDPGVATGLAVTAVGGDVLFIEATGYPGKGRLTVTGQLGEVMQESAQAALSWVRSHAVQLGLDPTWFADHDIHVHIPAGAVPKDGPGGGVRPRRLARPRARGRLRRRAEASAPPRTRRRAAGGYPSRNELNSVRQAPPAAPAAKRHRSWCSRRPVRMKAVRSTSALPARR